MADYLNETALADDYTDENSVGPDFTCDHVTVTVNDNDIYFQVAQGVQGDWQWMDEREFHSIEQALRVGNIVGFRARNAVPGEVAVIDVALCGPKDPDFSAGSPLPPTVAVNTGVILLWPAATPPSGYVLCDGSTYDGTQPAYSALYAVIGTTFGGTGQSAFEVPDLRGRVPVGLAAGGKSQVDALGNNEGLAETLRNVSHNHVGGINNIIGLNNNTGVHNNFTSGPHETQAIGGDLDNNNSPAYLVLNYIIKL